MTAIEPKDRIFVALDTPERAKASDLAVRLAGAVGGIKLGLEFFTAQGPEGVRAVAGDARLFLDLKLHDVPNTVAGAVRAAAPLRPMFLSVHAGGGRAMLEAAVAAAREASEAGSLPRPRLLGITLLTSLDEADLESLGQHGSVLDQVRRLAELARAGGLDGVVCSPREVAALRADHGPGFLLVVPGIRPAGSAAHDQKRVLTPTRAVAAGADYLVIGR
ncbi:MAG TPA: orotidine-5'-phosphate decarboxylase, partial [Kiloniellales bacterium]|nr:orotidine-5'-phosphate decarboxylase [Kiloniellales bacterium]